MKELIEKRKKRKCIIGKILLIFFALWIVLSLIFGIADINEPVTIVIVIICGYAAMIMGIVYYVYWSKLRHIKWLEKAGYGELLNNLEFNDNILPKSKLYYNDVAIYNKQCTIVIPYAEIAWVYLKITNAYGVITVERTLMVYCKDKELFQLPAETDEFQWLLENYIFKSNPRVIIGFSPEKKKLYKQTYKKR